MSGKISSIDISIVILSKNEEKYIGFTLEMIFRQDIDKKYEVIIIDSGSRDSTLDIARRYPVKIFKIPKEEFGHGRTRNKSAEIAEGRIIVFLNADAIPLNEKWLKSLIYHFENDQKIVGVYSRIYPHADCNPLRSWEILNEVNYLYNEGRVKYIENLDNYDHMSPRDKRNFLAFQTISCAIRRDFLLKYPFRNIGFGEDLEWSKRIMENRFKIVFEPRSSVSHSHNFYFSFTKTFKKYFDDAKLNKDLLNIWPWYSFPMLVGTILYKIFKDIGCILILKKRMSYKIGWLFCSPIIRLAEFFGIILGANSQCLPRRLQTLFSLVGEIKKR
ncbi:MAG: glycosyltransferase family 2 protein [Candidatus Omnitrophica bacterium]|nr:glycosyltransferase family 2 protein [Candidatus Omnitrophota bacterium]